LTKAQERKLVSTYKDKPGDWSIAVGVLICLVGLGFVLSTLFYFRPRYVALRDHGRVATGIAIEQVTSSRTTNKGRVRNSFGVLIGYNPANSVPYNLSADIDEDAPTTLPPTTPSMTGDELVAELAGSMDALLAKPTFPFSYHMSLSKAEQGSIPLGTRISLTFLPESPQTAQLTQDVRSYSTFTPMAMGLGFFLGGVILIFLGVKKRSLS
jgi:hypothetical protein